MSALHRVMAALGLFTALFVGSGVLRAQAPPTLTLSPQSPSAFQPFSAVIRIPAEALAYGFYDLEGSPAISVNGFQIHARIDLSCGFGGLCPPGLTIQDLPTPMAGLAPGAYEFILFDRLSGNELARFTFGIAERYGVPTMAKTSVVIAALWVGLAGIMVLKRGARTR